MKRNNITLLLLLLFIVCDAFGSNYNYANQSVLTKGEFYKISVEESGIYKISYSKIKSLGLNPQKVQIYGYGGALLEEDFSKNLYKDDLPIVSVYQELGNDSVFNEGDFILFYANAATSWHQNSSNKNVFDREINCYSSLGYYFIGERSQGTLFAQKEVVNPQKDSTIDINEYTDRIIHEKELYNIGRVIANTGTGRELFGENFSYNKSQDFKFEISDIIKTEPSYIKYVFAAKDESSSICEVSINGEKVSSKSIGGVGASQEYVYGEKVEDLKPFYPSSNSLDININSTIKDGKAFLDYFILNVRRKLNKVSSSFTFRDPTSVQNEKKLKFNITNADNKTIVFDITDTENMKQMQGTFNNGTYSFFADGNELKEYVCLSTDGKYPEPNIVGKIDNQNIHGEDSIDMVIIAPEKYLTSVEELAELHRKTDSLKVLVVTPEKLYNEFSSGTPDATAYRRALKMFYDRQTKKPKYLLLFGSSLYDNRLKTSFLKGTTKTNDILSYQSQESLDGTLSYVSDDYFGYLDDLDGANLRTEKIDIGIGRIPVYSLEEAEGVVEKIKKYLSNDIKGPWKNKLLFIADDGNNNTHISQSDYIANYVEENNPTYIANKVYVDAYQREISASSVSVPDGIKRFKKLIDAGLLMVNYTGHGSTTNWTAEGILTYSDIVNMRNDKLPLWVTATCDFTRYDHQDVTGGEMAFINPKGGAIGLFTTTRIVYSSKNYLLNKALIKYLFSYENGERYTLGDIMYKTKRSDDLYGDNNRFSFTLIGDPAMKLLYPSSKMGISSINENVIKAGKIDTLESQNEVTLKGKVYNSDGSVNESFNGLLYADIYDVKENKSTLGYVDSPFKFSEYSSLLFSGEDSVKNGNFSLSFVVPKDISYSNGLGCINLYACNDKIEAQGYYRNIAFSGSKILNNKDVVGPEIKMFFNSFDYRDGDVVNRTPTFIAKISDESGLNTSGNGIGHDLVLEIDKDPNKNYVLNEYYYSDLGSYKSGIVKFVLPELEEGKHYLSFKAWDNMNNPSKSEMNFIVNKDNSPNLNNLICVTTASKIQFRFEHNRPSNLLKVRIDILNLLGKKVQSLKNEMQTDMFESDIIEWNYSDYSGERIKSGIYLCKVVITDEDGNSSFITKKIRVPMQ